MENQSDRIISGSLSRTGVHSVAEMKKLVSEIHMTAGLLQRHCDEGQVSPSSLVLLSVPTMLSASLKLWFRAYA